MPYTLTKGLLWFALALLLGIAIGWLLRSVRATRQLRAARHARHDAAEVEQRRTRIVEREGPGAEPAETPTAPDELPDDAVDTGEEAAIDGRVPSDVPETDEAHEPPPSLPADPAAAPTGEPIEPIAAFGGSPLGEAGERALGLRTEQNDLTAVEGIDAAVAERCRGIGITTWAELAATEVSLLRTMLADAGPDFVELDPTTWPQQARLLADGRWDQFHQLTAELRGGGSAE